MMAPLFLGHEFLLQSIAVRVDTWLHDRTYSSHFGRKLTIINAMRRPARNVRAHNTCIHPMGPGTP